MSKNRILVPLAVLILSAFACSFFPPRGETAPVIQPSAGEGDTASVLDSLGGRPCPGSEFTCVTLDMPLDHDDPDNGQTIGVTFAVLPASGEHKGMFVTAVGGPGGSGLAVADSYTAAFDPSIPEHFDIVFFDQRGIGASGGLQCTQAAADYYRTEMDPWSPDGEVMLATAASDFVAACTAAMGRDGWLPYLGTDQAVEDLEYFRQAIGDERFWLYGESYGTQFAQTYAAAHPEHLARLILDGPVDLTLSGTDFLAEQAAAFNDVLLMTLEACNADEACAADMGGEAVAAYDALAARLREGPAYFSFPQPSDGTVGRPFSFTDLESTAAGSLYSEAGRMILLRALAAASSRGDLVPLARILYDELSLDPQTELPVPDPSFSNAMYYAVECNDYDLDAPDEYLDIGDAVEASLPRFVSIYYGDLPCPFWPEDEANPGRPAPLVAAGIPTLVMVGTADPATPLPNAERIVSRLDDGFLVVEQGGPHVIFGWGNECVDGLVTDFLVDEVLPARETSCPGAVTDEYVPLAPEEASAFADPLEALASVDDEVFYLPEYYYWDLETETSVGCPFGGRLTFGPASIGEVWELDHCAFSRGFILTGSALYDYVRGELTLTVSVTGLADGELVYTRSDDWTLTVTGTYAGQEVNIIR